MTDTRTLEERRDILKSKLNWKTLDVKTYKVIVDQLSKINILITIADR